MTTGQQLNTCEYLPSSWSRSTHILCFFAGTLVPTIVYLLLYRTWGIRREAEENIAALNEADDADNADNDDDLAETRDSQQSGDDRIVVHKNSRPSAQWDLRDAPYKMVLCVNMELSMGKGKIAAQCAHAAVGCFERALRQCPVALRAWKRTGCAKIALKCSSANDFTSLLQQARTLDIPCYLVEDAGRTQIAAGSQTVLGLGPAPVSVFAGVTDHLKLM
jgi:peptidyl-tRNA hydrolase, PTH2 family